MILCINYSLFILLYLNVRFLQVLLIIILPILNILLLLPFLYETTLRWWLIVSLIIFSLLPFYFLFLFLFFLFILHRLLYFTLFFIYLCSILLCVLNHWLTILCDKILFILLILVVNDVIKCRYIIHSYHTNLLIIPYMLQHFKLLTFIILNFTHSILKFLIHFCLLCIIFNSLYQVNSKFRKFIHKLF